MTNTAIDTAIYDTQRFADGAESGNNISKAGATFLSVLEIHQAKMNEALAEWLDLATQMDPDQNGKTQVERRLSYPFFNEAQQTHVALYGNRTIDEITSGAAVESNTVNFCATENLNYWENRWDKIKDEEDSMNGPSYEKSNCFVRLEEARRHWAYVSAKHKLNVAMFELLNGEPFAYKKYEERKPVATATKSSTASLAAKLMAKGQLTKGFYAGSDERAS